MPASNFPMQKYIQNMITKLFREVAIISRSRQHYALDSEKEYSEAKLSSHSNRTTKWTKHIRDNRWDCISHDAGSSASKLIESVRYEETREATQSDLKELVAKLAF